MREHTINRVLLFGRVTADPEVGVLKNGAMFANLVLRTYEPRRDSESKKMGESPQYHRIRAYGRAAGVVVDCAVQKGAMLMVEGRLDHEAWCAKNGEHVNRTAIICSYMNVMGEAREDGDHQAAPEPAPLTPSLYHDEKAT